jgi:FkbM family methyltransferase
MENPIAQATARHGNFVFFRNDDPIGACLHHYGEWAQQELDLFDLILTETSNIADIGANIGTHSVFFSKKASKGRVISFEPQLYIFELLCANLLMNGCYNVFPINAALSNKPSRQRMVNFNPFNDGKVNYGEFKINSHDDKGILTSVFTLDGYFDSHKFDLIKMDVEGHELEALDGAKKIIKKHKPTLYIEYNSDTGNEELLQLLERSGYNCYWHVYTKHNPKNFNNKTQDVWCEENMIVDKTNYHKKFEGNIICVHRDKVQPRGLPVVGDQRNLLQFLTHVGAF